MTTGGSRITTTQEASAHHPGAGGAGCGSLRWGRGGQQDGAETQPPQERGSSQSAAGEDGGGRRARGLATNIVTSDAGGPAG